MKDPKAHPAKAFRTAILHSIANPTDVGLENSYQYFEDGILLVADGHVVKVGDAKEILPTLDDSVVVTELENKLITPGFIDTHIHYPQTGMIAAYGEQLLDWLNNYTFPEEKRFADKDYAREVAVQFLDELARNGTTTALVFGTVHKESVDVFFQESEKRNLRMIAGKVLMDRNAPDDLKDTPESGYEDSKALIEKWHNKGRLHYAVTPRFAPTSTSEQLRLAGKLLEEYPDVYMHTHLSENQKEIEWVQALFPESKNYLDVYDQHGLLSSRSVFAHGVHLCEGECSRLSETDSAIAFCPTSNLFLGSGLFPLSDMEAKGIKVGMGTDVGAGTSFSLLQTMSEAYKVMQLQGDKLHPFKSLYQATLGGAKALSLDNVIGNFESGKEADFVVLDLNATQLMRFRMEHAKSLEDKLFVLITIGDDRTIANTYSYGECVYEKQ
ncbi:guanine deaminase [Enterovibrio nigricans]|uniref:Guanine deaminase n=1 Tax=Enterovibrio nigricans DSM 22720 TaxID=1121868 RepID=A0A1T4UHW6_9GAMM|nr:guanine deaminase [Enterovibrio nigricans]PKF49958.1 guanine deaminase [Enterovibrio nigricans]SKA52196.1 guanine deaminase [Enterovibrio nigricans DSM 22720]